MSMKNDFISIFKAIESTEQESFRQYIQYFYGQQKTVLNVFNQVVQAIASNEEKRFSSSVSKNKKIQNDLSDLKKWLLEFLTVQEVKSNSLNAQFLILDTLHKRQLKSVFMQKSKQLSKTLTEHPSPDIWMMLRKLRLAHIHYFELEIDPLQDYQAELHQLLDSLDSFYISAKLKYTAELQSRAYILQENYNPRLLAEILNIVELKNSLDPTIKRFYLPLLNLVKDKSETAYKELKVFLTKNQTHESKEKLSVLLYLLNFAINQIRQGNEIYKNEYFELNEIGITQSLFIAAGYMSTEVFTNAVNLACLFQKYDWAKRFIDDWSKHLEPKTKMVTVNLALARIYFDLKNFNEANSLLLEITAYKNISINVNVRLLLARTYYELKQPDKLQISYCENLYLYVYRSKIIGLDMKKSILNFIKILRSLIMVKSKKQLVKELESLEHPIICYDWLKAKIDERKR